jgi:hypothetical protein
LRLYKVLLDGVLIAQLADGGSLSVDIPPGDHTIQAKIDWCSTDLMFFHAAEDPVIFEVFSKLRGPELWLGFVRPLIPGGYIGIRRVTPLH